MTLSIPLTGAEKTESLWTAIGTVLEAPGAVLHRRQTLLYSSDLVQYSSMFILFFLLYGL